MRSESCICVTTSTAPTSPTPGLTVTPASGSLAAGKSVTITVTWAKPGVVMSAQLTVAPGGLTVTVTYRPG
jgi:hypothetical protein